LLIRGHSGMIIRGHVAVKGQSWVTDQGSGGSWGKLLSPALEQNVKNEVEGLELGVGLEGPAILRFIQQALVRENPFRGS
jgi:hypothetical protein